MRAFSIFCRTGFAAAFAAGAFAQSEIYSNGSSDPSNPGLSTGSQTGSGIPAPSGGAWSEAQAVGGSANAIAGFSNHLTGTTGAYRFADDFIVSATGGWRIDAVAVFAYQPGHSAAGSPFSAANLRIWDGPPGDPQSAVVFGDTDTNRLISSQATNLYRVFNTVIAPLGGSPDESKRIWETHISAGGITLPLGVYWLDWQYSSADPDGEAFSPPVTVIASRGVANWNAQQFRTDAGGAWVAALDTGKPPVAADVPQDFPFIIIGEAFVTDCIGDLDGDRSVGLSDLTLMLAHFGTVSGATLEDGDIDADGDVDLADLTQLLSAFGTICP